MLTYETIVVTTCAKMTFNFLVFKQNLPLFSFIVHNKCMLQFAAMWTRQYNKHTQGVLHIFFVYDEGVYNALGKPAKKNLYIL